MFHSAQMVLDIFGKPVFVLPVELPKDGCHLKVGDRAIDFMVNEDRIGQVSDIDPAILALVASQKTVGIIVYPENSSKPCPKHLTHIATVEAQ